MERIKKRKLKFPCLFGGNDESPRCRSVQSCSPANPTAEQSLFKFDVGKSTSKQDKGNQMKKFLAKGLSNGISAKKRSPSILAKLMGRGRLSSKNVILNPNTTNVKIVDHSSDEYRKNTELFCSGTECKWRDAIENVPEITNQVTEGFDGGQVGFYGYDYFGDEGLHMLRSGSISESEEITMPFRIIIDQHDRLTHSLCHMSESSLIREATNRMLERWNTTPIKEDVGTVNKVGMLEVISFPDKETRPAESDKTTGLVAVSDIFASPTGLGSLLGNCSRDGQGDRHFVSTSRSTSLLPSFNDPNHKRNVCHEDDADEKVYNEPSNQGRTCRRKVRKDVFNHEEDIPLKNVRSSKRFQSFNHEEDIQLKNVRSSKRLQSFQKSTGAYFKNEDSAKYQPSITDIDVDAQLSGSESEDATFASDGFESINYRLQDLKKNIHLLTVESKLISNKLRLIPKIKPIGQQSSDAIPQSVIPESTYMAHILQTLEKYATDPSCKSETTHPPIDPRLFKCLEKFYFEGTTLLRIEKRLFYDYIEQMFIRTSKSTVAYPWANSVKIENQLGLPKLNLEDQICKVVDEIEKDEDEDFVAAYYDKDLQWVRPTNEIDILGKFVAELVLNDLLLEVIDI